MSRTIYTISCEDAISFLCESTWGFAELDADGKFIWVNKAYCEILNAPRELVLGTYSKSWTHPEDIGVDTELRKQVEDGTLPGYTLAKRYIQRGSTPKRPLVIWGMLRVQGKFSETGEFAGYRVQFSPYTPDRMALLSYKVDLKKATQWATENWRTLVLILATLTTLIFGSSEKLLILLQDVKNTTDSVDSVLDSSSSGQSPVPPSP